MTIHDIPAGAELDLLFARAVGLPIYGCDVPGDAVEPFVCRAFDEDGGELWLHENPSVCVPWHPSADVGQALTWADVWTRANMPKWHGEKRDGWILQAWHRMENPNYCFHFIGGPLGYGETPALAVVRAVCECEQKKGQT